MEETPTLKIQGSTITLTITIIKEYVGIVIRVTLDVIAQWELFILTARNRATKQMSVRGGMVDHNHKVEETTTKGIMEMGTEEV